MSSSGHGRLLIVSAPSGAGKTTLGDQVLKCRPHLTRAITCTTRERRPGEKLFFGDTATAILEKSDRSIVFVVS